MKLQIPSYLEKVKDVTLTKEQLISFESEVKQKYEDGDIPAPIHLSKDNISIRSRRRLGIFSLEKSLSCIITRI